MGLAEFANPSSAIGDLNTRLEQVRRELHRKADSHDINSINRSLDSLQHSVRELSSMVDGHCHKLREQEEALRLLREQIEHSLSEV